MHRYDSNTYLIDVGQRQERQQRSIVRKLNTVQIGLTGYGYIAVSEQDTFRIACSSLMGDEDNDEPRTRAGTLTDV